MPARTLGNGLPLLGGTTEIQRIPFNFSSVSRLLQNSRNAMQHNFSIGLGSYTVAQHFKISPSIAYSEVWYAQKLRYSYSPVAQAVRIDTTYGFNRANTYSGSVSINTAFYGTIVRRGTHKIQALRHKVTPSLTFSAAPDFRDRNQPGAEILGSGYRDPYGISITDPTRLNAFSFNNFSNVLYNISTGGPQSQISFQLQNAVEMKVRDSNDTTGVNPFKKVDLFRNFDFSLGYDFIRDSMKLTPLTVVFSTQIAQKLTLNSGAQFSPYQRNSQGIEINKYLFESNPKRLLRLSTVNLSANYAFNPTTGKKRSVVRRAVAPSNDPTLGTVGGPNYYADYVDFEIPWELSLTYNALYTTNSIPLTSAYVRQFGRPPLLSSHTVGATGSVKLTESLRVTYNLGYDFVSQTVTYPNLGIFRDLHCWQVNASWIPFGITKGYNFTIAAKSSLLQDLKLNRNRYSQYQ